MALSFTPHSVSLHLNQSNVKLTLGFPFIKCVRISKARGKSNPSHLIIELTMLAVPLKFKGEEAVKDGMRLCRILERKRKLLLVNKTLLQEA